MAENNNIYDNLLIRACIDTVAKHTAKLTATVKGANSAKNKLNYLLQNKPNPYMNAYNFLYKIVSMLLTNNNTFMNSPSNVTLPVEDTTADMTWVSEGTASSDSDDNVGKVELLAYKLIKTIEVSANIKAMSIDEFETFLVKTLSRKVKVALDAAIANGDNSSKAQGICNKITGIQTAAADTLDYDDICDLLASVKAAYKQRGSICNEYKYII